MAVQSQRMSALQQLAKQLPVASQRVAQGQAAARDIQLQQAVQRAPQTAGVQAAQQTGAAVAHQAGQQVVQGAQQQVQQVGQVAQLGAQQQGQEAQARVASAESGARQEQMDQAQRLGQLDAKLKQELYDDTIKFQQDELGRTVFNEQQLADYARVSAQSDETYNNMAQRAEHASKRKLEMMERAHKIVMEDLQQKYALAEQAKDQVTQLEIRGMISAANAQMAREKADAANRQAMWQAGGTVVGAVAGSLIPIPGVGTAVGAAIGGSLGGAVGGLAGGLF